MHRKYLSSTSVLSFAMKLKTALEKTTFKKSMVSLSFNIHSIQMSMVGPNGWDIGDWDRYCNEEWPECWSIQAYCNCATFIYLLMDMLSFCKSKYGSLFISIAIKNDLNTDQFWHTATVPCLFTFERTCYLFASPNMAVHLLILCNFNLWKKSPILVLPQSILGPRLTSVIWTDSEKLLV